MKTDDFEILFQDFSFDAAVEYFGEKLPMTHKVYKALGQKYRSGAFTVAAYTQAEVLNQFYNSLMDAIENGTTMENFRSSMKDFLEEKGYDGISAYQADNIFRTNVQAAYQAGHYESMTCPEVMAARPYWMYDAVGDSRTRPSHLAIDGKVFAADSPVWDTWYPPNGYRCRCTVVTLSRRQMEKRGLTVETAVPKTVTVRGRDLPVSVDAGFAYNAAKREFRPDMGSYPKEIRAAYLLQLEQKKRKNKKTAISGKKG